MEFDLHGKTALVSGCSQGLGFECVKILAKHGANVYGVSIGDDSELKEIVSQYDGNYESSTLSLTTPGAIRSVVQEAKSKYSHIDILLNFASSLKKDDTLSITKSEWSNAMDINVHAAFFLSQEVIKVMIEQHTGGKIINASGVLPFDTTQFCSYYTANGALEAMTKYLAYEFAPNNIQINAISFGFMDFGTKLQQCLGNEDDTSILHRIPAKRWGTPKDIEGLVLLLSSSQSDYITGACIPIDGGYSI